MSETRATRTVIIGGEHRRPLPLTIVVSGAPAHPQRFVLAKGSCVIGASKQADIVVEHETVSRLHASLELVPQGVLLEDRQSKNGTFFLGQRVQAMVLSPGSSFRVGHVDVNIELTESDLTAVAPGQAEQYGELIGRSPAMRRLFALLESLQGSLVNVLVEGPSGTGKELIARAIHKRSAAMSGPLVAVNCGALEKELVRSELFGHRKGAFTGAIESRVGAFEAAHGGTLLMDEIGELPLAIQPVLLRVLESRCVVRVGETAERSVNLRVIAATNRDLREEIRAGRFREDLYYRLAVVRLSIPPLSARPEDIRRLAEHFARLAGGAALPERFLAALERQHWPGNGRQLRNAVEAYLAIGAMPELAEARGDDLDRALLGSIDASAPYAEQKDALVDWFTRFYLDRLLGHTHGNRSEAARISKLERGYLGKLAAKYGFVKKKGALDEDVP